MRAFYHCLFLICLVATAPVSAMGDVSEDSCVILENGLVPELFGVAGELVSYKRSIPVKRVGHVLCTASWDNPDKAELEAAYTKKVQEWGRNMASGKKEPMPKSPALVYRVSVTLVATQFDSAAAAVTSLEDAVATLSKGVTVNVGGKDYTTTASFGDWIDGLGDKAIFSDKGELMVASDARRFAVMVEVSADPEVNRAKALALAERIMTSF